MRPFKPLAISLLLVLTIASGALAAPRSDDDLTRPFLQLAAPHIQAALAGIYGAPPAYEGARILEVRPVADDDRYLEVVVQVETFRGAHNPLGLDTITFKVSPGQVVVGKVKHKEHPDVKDPDSTS